MTYEELFAEAVPTVPTDAKAEQTDVEVVQMDVKVQQTDVEVVQLDVKDCLLYTSPSPRD